MITNKQKIMLYLIKELSELGKNSRFMIVKCLFLLKQESNIEDTIKFYNFFPYKYGPFSNLCFLDLNSLQSNGFIEDNNRPKITEKADKTINNLRVNIKEKVKNIAKRFKTDKEIKEYVYANYPEYAVKSITQKKNINLNSHGFFTIGYEGKDIDKFLNFLIEQNIELLIDVRKNPFSMNFSFTKKKLFEYLKKVEIDYLHLPELGVESSQRKSLNSIDDYKQLFENYRNATLPNNNRAIDKIIQLGKEKRIALMCFEQDKDMCHRGVISEYLVLKGIKVIHL